MKLIFVRHGEPLRDDFGIAETGKKQLELLGKYIKNNFNVNEIISASSQRGAESSIILKEMLNISLEYHSWLNEFKYRIPILEEKGVFPWELAPEYWINENNLLDFEKVLNSKLLENSQIEEKVKEVWQGLDEIILKNGYRRENNLYVVEKANKNEIVIVTHFATMAIMLAHLLNISILISLNMLFMAPSSYTVMATEEINKGKVIFRCLELGSTKHLFENNHLKSEYGRQAEIKE